VLDGAVLPRGIHGLEDEEKGPGILCVKFLLEFGKFFAALVEQFLCVLLGVEFPCVAGVGAADAEFPGMFDAVAIGEGGVFFTHRIQFSMASGTPSTDFTEGSETISSSISQT